MTDLATLDDLKKRLDWTLDADEERIAAGALEDASDLARAHADRPDWTDVTAPRLARTLVLKACKRYMSNPEGLTQSRAGDETLGWNDAAGENAGTVYFSDDEIKHLAQLGGRRHGLVSVQVRAWNSSPAKVEGLVPSADGTKSFPFFNSDTDPYA